MGSPVDDLLQIVTAVRAVEEEFGLDWLVRRSGNTGQSAGTDKHPVPKLWKETKDRLRGLVSEGQLTPDQHVLALLRLGTDLLTARLLRGYEETIRPRLTDSSAFAGCAYEVYVAALAVRYGYKVAFLQPSIKPGEKRADLLLQTSNQELYVECTRKDSSLPFVLDNKLLQSVCEQIISLQDEFDIDRDIVVASLGDLAREAIPGILDILRRSIAAGEISRWINPELGCAVDIREQIQPPPTVVADAVQGGIEHDFLWVPPRLLNLAGATIVQAKTVDGENGRVRLIDRRSATVYLIDSHRLGSILQSFRQERQQLPSELSGQGMICIDLDLSRVLPQHSQTYLELVADTIRLQFGPTRCTRIGAVVLTTRPEFMEIPESDGPSFHYPRMVVTVRNPYHSLPDNLIVPGENPAVYLLSKTKTDQDSLTRG